MSSAADLAREIADLKRRLAAVERSSQLGRSSIDAGTLTVNDESGQPVLAVGKQEDGSFKVVGSNGGSVVANDVDLLPGTITETEIADDAISTPKLRANSITGDKVAVGTLTADRLSVGTLPENVVADPSFEDSPTRVARLATATGSTWAFTGSSAFDGSFAARITNTAGGTARMLLTDTFPVTPGDVYVLKAAIRGTGASGGGNILLRVVDGAGVASFIQTTSPSATGAWVSVQTSGTIPAGAVSAQVFLQSTSQTTGTWDYDLVDVRRQLTGVTIQDGTIAGSTLLVDTPSNASVRIDGETGEVTLTGTDGKKVTLVPSNINPEMRFFSKSGNTFAFMNQPATNDNHASFGVNSGAFIPPDGTSRSLRMWLNSQSDEGRLECVRRSDQVTMGGYVFFGSHSIRIGNFNDTTGLDTYLDLDNTGKLTVHNGDIWLPDAVTDIGRGMITNVSFSNNTISVPVNSETTLLGLSNFTWRAGRAYKIEITLVIGVGSQLNWLLRDGASGGIIRAINSVSVTPANNSGARMYQSFSHYVRNPGGSDVTTDLAFRGLSPLGTTANSIFATATNPFVMTVYDVGIASAFPGTDITTV